MKTIGIDLGTTNTVVSFFENDEVLILPNSRGARLTPSIVAFREQEGILIGESAKNQGMANPENTIYAVKRSMGSSINYTLDNKNYTPDEISSFILAHVKKEAEEYLGTTVSQAVITVPAYFTEAARKATKKAGELAGLRVLRLLSEPTAAAMAYARNIDDTKNILVYDLGGGTFDVTLLEKKGNEFIVKSNSGFTKLGGIDFDQALFGFIEKRLSSECDINFREQPVLERQLRELVERAKIELSMRKETVIAIPFLNNKGKVVNIRCSITRQELEDLILPMIQKTIEQTKRTISDAGIQVNQVDRLILAGGSTRIPLVSQTLSELLGIKGEAKVNPDEVVALGAGFYSSIKANDLVLRDVTPFSLGVEIAGGNFLPLIKRNTTVPAGHSRIFTTITDYQKVVEIHVLQKDPGKKNAQVSLGRFMLSGIKAAPKGAPKVKVSFILDPDGILKVEADDLDTLASSHIKLSAFETEGAFSWEDRIQKLLREGKGFFQSKKNAALYKEWRELSDKSNEALRNKDQESLENCVLALETLMLEVGALEGGINENF